MNSGFLRTTREKICWEVVEIFEVEKCVSSFVLPDDFLFVDSSCAWHAAVVQALGEKHQGKAYQHDDARHGINFRGHTKADHGIDLHGKRG